MQRSLLRACLLGTVVAAAASGFAAADSLGPLPFAADCIQADSNANRALALDAAGNIYAIAICAGSVQLTVSSTAGATWSVPIVVTSAADSATIAGGSLAGHAIVVWASMTTVTASTTTDYGASMSPPAAVVAGAVQPRSGLDAVAVDATFHLAVAASAGTVLTARSLDRGGAWEPQVTVSIPWAFVDLLHDAMTGDMEIVADDPNVYRSRSVDGGAMYTPYAPLPGLCCIYYSDWALGCGLLYATGNNSTDPTVGDLIWRLELAAATSPEQIVTLGASVARSRQVAVDTSGNAFTVARVFPSNQIEMIRWGAGEPTVDAPVVVASDGENPHVAACGSDTVYVTYAEPATSTIQLARFCLGPAPCCAAGACPVVAPRITLLRNADVATLHPLMPALSAVLAPGDGSGTPGLTALDRVAPAQRIAAFTPRALAGELAVLGQPLVFYELEESDSGQRMLVLSKVGQDLFITF